VHRPAGPHQLAGPLCRRGGLHRYGGFIGEVWDIMWNDVSVVCRGSGRSTRSTACRTWARVWAPLSRGAAAKRMTCTKRGCWSRARRWPGKKAAALITAPTYPLPTKTPSQALSGARQFHPLSI